MVLSHVLMCLFIYICKWDLKHWLKSEKYISAKQLISLLYSPVLFVFGSSGNLLICIVMRRGSLKKISTCFYMAVLGLLDTGKFTPSEEGNVKKKN